MPASARTPVSTPVTTDATPPVRPGDVLDWARFSAAGFPGRRRHDLEAVVAYGRYRRSVATSEDVSDEPGVDDRPTEITATQSWEDDGGAWLRQAAEPCTPAS